jgi:flagellar biosynthetic protein FlhB
MGRGLVFDHDTVFRDAALGERLMEMAGNAALLAIPACIVLAAAGVAAYWLLGGFLFTASALEPKWNRLDPIGGIKRMFSAASLAEVGKNLLEAVLVITVAVLYIWASIGDFSNVLAGSQGAPFASMGGMVLTGLLFVVGALVISALVDVPLQIWKHGHGLRMSLEEVKREMRETEGDPQLKAKVRSAQREIAKRRMMQEVPTADVVVTNPTHFAVALKYDEGRSAAPRVVAKGSGLIAQRIRELATGAGVPIVEAPPLARALFAKAEIGDEIPQALYTAVAQVLAFVFQLRAAAEPVASDPYEIPGVEIPPGLDPLGDGVTQ